MIERKLGMWEVVGWVYVGVGVNHSSMGFQILADMDRLPADNSP